MRDRAAERRLLGALGVDVDELVIERDVGEAVHALLVDEEPVRHAEPLTDHAVELLARDGSCHGRPRELREPGAAGDPLSLPADADCRRCV